MALKKRGTVSSFARISPTLARFRLLPEPGSPFVRYEAGQYIALFRDDCRLTRKTADERGVRYAADLDPSGLPRRGPIGHAYSIASAPFETERDGHLEFYVVLERLEEDRLGRLT